eukprot:TRINITY_DN22310_c0_g2_i2.p1 TRINITY_DN22310_c0_g2~~TRINITY_DN22310_c0_g2_i2.p1  ORF type:complete len:220 (-),score=35.96 TRINITY_DN22310_c0_g2_i2:113-772(-)
MGRSVRNVLWRERRPTARWLILLWLAYGCLRVEDFEEDLVAFEQQCARVGAPGSVAEDVLAMGLSESMELQLKFPEAISGSLDDWALMVAQRALCLLDAMAQRLDWPNESHWDTDEKLWHAGEPPEDIQQSVLLLVSFERLRWRSALRVMRGAFRVIQLCEWDNPFYRRYLSRRYHLMLGKVVLKDTPAGASLLYSVVRPLIGERTRRLLGFESSSTAP